MPGRSFSSPYYRFGFNGKENDNEVKGITGSQQDYGFRIYDTRLGRFLSVDPLTRSYPWYTPYQFSGNSPAANVDIDGKEDLYFMAQLEKTILGSSYLERISNGMVERAKNDIRGSITSIKSAKEVNDYICKQRCILSTVGDYSKSLMYIKTLQLILSESAMELIDDYSELIRKSADGNPEAIGALAFELVMLAQDIESLRALKGCHARGAGEGLRYRMGENDLDFRGTNVKFEDALDLAFEQTGIPRNEFEVTKWGKDENGKSVPVEWRSEKSGAEVNVDLSHDWSKGPTGPDAPHIGWKVGKKGKVTGHIILDDVPRNRPVYKLDPSNSKKIIR